MKRKLLTQAAISAAVATALLPVHARAAERGMPQLNIADFAPQLVWLLIWFVILYVLMAWFGLPRIKAIMETRKRRREDDLARAEQLKAEAAAASAAYQKTLADARAQAMATIKASADRMAAEAAEQQRTLAAELAERIAAAERRIVESKEQALADIRSVAVDVGRSVVEKLTGSAPDPARMTAAVEHALAGQVR